jgi:SAM-dependent methyltransferase
MATKAIVLFGKKHAGLFSAPVLEIGSKNQPSYEQFSPREIHPQVKAEDYIGIDIEAGENVNFVIDLCDPKSVEKLGAERFQTVHCHCVLEHVPDIFQMCRNIEKILKPGGKLFVSAPSAWRLHRIPVDMWRFTPQSIDYLFPQIHFKPELCAFSTRDPQRFFPADEIPEFHVQSGLKKVNPLLNLAVRVLRKLKCDRGYFSERALLMESNLMMIGEKKQAPVYTFFPAP